VPAPGAAAPTAGTADGKQAGNLAPATGGYPCLSTATAAVIMTASWRR
jgi:hypothetical protein